MITIIIVIIISDNINEGLGLLTKVRKQERGGVTSGSGNYFGKVRSYEKKHTNTMRAQKRICLLKLMS